MMSTIIDAPHGRDRLLSAAHAAELSPHDLENLIECWRTIGLLEPDQNRKRDAFRRMSELIGKRSVETIARMEAERFGKSFG